MTQALVNNLNITQDTTLATQPKSNPDDKFEKLYKQCVYTDKQNNDEKQSIDNNKNNTLGSIKKVNTTVLDELKTVLEQTSEEIVAEAAIDLGLIKNTENINNDITEDISDESITEIENLPTDIAENSQEIENNATNLNLTAINTPISSIVANQNLQDNNQEDSEAQNSNALKVRISSADIESFTDDFGANSAEKESVVTQPSDIKENDGVKLQDIIEEDKLKELNIEEIDTSVSSGNEESENDLMQNQTPQEQGVKAMLHTNTELQNTKFENAIKTQPSNTSQPANSTEKIIEQISKQLSNLHNTSRVNIVLNPESLGKMSLQIINNPEGLSAQFTVATQEARELIMKGLDGLKESLLSQGVNVDNVSVKLNDIQKSEYNPDWTEQEGSRGGNKQHKEHHKGEKEKEFEQMMFGLTNEEEQA